MIVGKFGKSFTNEEGQIIYPKYVIQHPDYVMEELSGYFNDITLIKLDNDVNLEEGSLAQIASAPLRLDAECKTVGWGVDKSTKVEYIITGISRAVFKFSFFRILLYLKLNSLLLL